MRLIPIFLLAISSQLPAAITVKHANPAIPDTAYAEDQLQAAIDATSTTCGDIIEIDPGASRHGTGSYILRGPALAPALGGPAVPPSYAKDCAASGKYITIRSSKAYQLTPGKRVGADDAGNLAFVGLSGTACTVIIAEQATGFYRLQGLEIAATPKICESGGNHILRITYQTPLLGNIAIARLDQYPHHIIIDQCWVHGIDSWSIRDGVNVDGISIQLINSTVDNIRTPVGGPESHALGSFSGFGPLRVVNNKLSSGMITVLFGGAPAVHQWARMENVEFLGNWLYRPFKWLDWVGTTDPTPLSPCPVDYDGHGATYRNTSAVTYWECQGDAPGTWTQLADVTAYTALTSVRLPTPNKNIFEIKDGSKFHLEGNVLDQAYSWASQQQLGACFLFNMVTGGVGNATEMATHVVIENNICQHAPKGVATGGNLPVGGYWENANRPVHDHIFRNNLFQHMAENMYTFPDFGTLTGWAGKGTWLSIGVGTRNNLTYDHNTWQSEYTKSTQAYNSGLSDDSPYDPANPGLGQRVINSIWTAGKTPFVRGDNFNFGNNATVGWGPYAEMSANAIIDNLGIGLSGMTSLTQHCTPGLYPECKYTTSATTFPPNCIGCQYPAPSTAGFTSYPNDLTLQTGSPLIAAGLDGKNIGADLNTVGWATAGAQAGTMAPYLAMKIRAVIPAATSVQVRFSAIDTSSCTVEARVYGFPLSSPAAAATVDTGTLDRLVTLTGLSGNTKYGLKVTCAGTYYREDEFRTP